MAKPFKDKRDAFVQAMKARGGDTPCPICHGRNFDLGEYAGIMHVSQETDVDATRVGTYVPCAMRVCTQCGHVDFFALYEYGMN